MLQTESTTVAPRRRRTFQDHAAEDAYAAFDASHRRGLVAYCTADLRNQADAEEVGADALFALWSNWPGLRARDDRTLRAYTFTTARRKLRQVAPRQRRQRQQTVPLGWGTDDMDGDPALVDPASRDDSPDAVDRRLARQLHAALGKLEPREQAAVLRRYGDRQTLAEVADELGITEAAANALVRRALSELRRSLIGVPTT